MSAAAYPNRPPLALVVGLPSGAADLCSYRLRLAGYQVARAAHGPAACELARSLEPSLVVVSRSLWALERRAVDVAASAIGADVIDESGVARALAL